MKLRLIVMLIAVIMFSGCATKYGLQFDSSPQGARVICNGVDLGYTPVTRYYDKSVKKQESLYVGACSAQWVSGTLEYYRSHWPVKQFPNGISETLQRPNVPGYQQDAEFALKVQQMQYQKEQAEKPKYNSGNSSSTVTCYKSGDISSPRMAYQFDSPFCPAGYHNSY